MNLALLLKIFKKKIAKNVLFQIYTELAFLAVIHEKL